MKTEDERGTTATGFLVEQLQAAQQKHRELLRQMRDDDSYHAQVAASRKEIARLKELSKLGATA